MKFFILLLLFVGLVSPTYAYADPVCPSGQKPPCPPGDGPTRIHPATGVVIDLTGAGLRITHEPAGIIIDITGAGYTCTEESISDPNGIITCSGGPAQIAIIASGTDPCTNEFRTDPCTTGGVTMSFSVEESTIIVDGLTVTGIHGFLMCNQARIYDQWKVDPSGVSLSMHAGGGCSDGTYFISSTGNGIVSWCWSGQCNNDAETLTVNGPAGLIIDPSGQVTQVDANTFTWDCHDHDQCARMENVGENFYVQNFPTVDEGFISRLTITIHDTNIQSVVPDR